ncbi:MAG: nuclear transport factor 2 family protein [Chitinophagaceae bacterium]|nr:nuclear transport factor 2 family protein [Chitinophagaceae bacterium]
MKDHKEIIEAFYTSFQRLDYKGMNALYSDDILFSNPFFGLLKGDDVKVMWEMKCREDNQLSVQFGPIELLDEEYATCQWEASYIYRPTQRRVHITAKAFMRLQNGMITEHSDAFKLSSWAARAYGFTGQLLGWTGTMKRRIQKAQRKQLRQFIAKAYPDE